VYGASLAIFRWGVEELPEEARIRTLQHRQRFDVGAYLALLRSSAVWLLAPTWIALNAVIGSWTSQSVFQLVRPPADGAIPRFPGQVLGGGVEPVSVSIGAAIGLLIFLAGLVFWGNRFKRFRRTTIIGFGIAGGFAMLVGVAGINHSQSLPWVVIAVLVLVLLAGLFVLAGATPAALGLLADMTEAHPEDRGAMMGLYSVFLGIGQIVGSLSAGYGADLLGIDGLILVSLLMLAIAVIPLGQLRASEHIVDAHGKSGRDRR
jgi:MFS family permease